jgi:hypothetical protein
MLVGKYVVGRRGRRMTKSRRGAAKSRGRVAVSRHPLFAGRLRSVYEVDSRSLEGEAASCGVRKARFAPDCGAH